MLLYREVCERAKERCCRKPSLRAYELAWRANSVFRKHWLRPNLNNLCVGREGSIYQSFTYENELHLFSYTQNNAHYQRARKTPGGSLYLIQKVVLDTSTNDLFVSSLTQVVKNLVKEREWVPTPKTWE